MSLANDIGAILEEAGLVVLYPNANHSYFKRMLPDTPPAVTVIYEYDGPDSIPTHDDYGAIRRPRFQIVTRNDLGSEEEALAEARASAIYLLLNGITNRVVAGTRYIKIKGVTTPGFQKRDDLNRACFGANYEAWVASSTGGG